MDRYFNVYHYLPEVDPTRLYVEANYRADGSRKTLHKKSDKVWGYYCFLEEYDQLCNYLNSYGRREYALLTQLSQPPPLERFSGVSARISSSISPRAGVRTRSHGSHQQRGPRRRHRGVATRA